MDLTLLNLKLQQIKIMLTLNTINKIFIDLYT